MASHSFRERQHSALKAGCSTTTNSASPDPWRSGGARHMTFGRAVQVVPARRPAADPGKPSPATSAFSPPPSWRCLHCGIASSAAHPSASFDTRRRRCAGDAELARRCYVRRLSVRLADRVARPSTILPAGVYLLSSTYDGEARRRGGLRARAPRLHAPFLPIISRLRCKIAIRDPRQGGGAEMFGEALDGLDRSCARHTCCHRARRPTPAAGASLIACAKRSPGAPRSSRSSGALVAAGAANVQDSHRCVQRRELELPMALFVGLPVKHARLGGARERVCRSSMERLPVGDRSRSFRPPHAHDSRLAGPLPRLSVNDFL